MKKCYCEKCGKSLDGILVNMFDISGADSDVFHFVQEEQDSGAVVVDTSPNWTGFELTENEMRDTISCPECKRFPFKDKEIQVYNIVRIVCFKTKDGELK